MINLDNPASSGPADDEDRFNDVNGPLRFNNDNVDPFLKEGILGAASFVYTTRWIDQAKVLKNELTVLASQVEIFWSSFPQRAKSTKC